MININKLSAFERKPMEVEIGSVLKLPTAGTSKPLLNVQCESQVSPTLAEHHSCSSSEDL